MKRYNPTEIEQKWQHVWDTEQVYKADLGSSKPKYIAMSMFNYPSGYGIHIGHALNYTISDVMARYKRQAGYESYHPVGWDAFGLPAENFAIKSGVSPQASMAKIIPGYHTQYKAMGWSNDWSKEISTHLPVYYKWTQWIFSEMYRAGLAYQDARMQWWCTKCQTVLANEQVIDGKCWRHDGADDPEVAKKEVKQWFFKVTEYADEMLAATDDLDWSEVVKSAQKNWIGKSMGAEIDFAVDDGLECADSLKFTPELTEKIKARTKTSTFRLEAKNLKVGDIAEMITRIDSQTTTHFGKARITKVDTMPLGELPNEYEGHEAYANDNEKLAAYRKYYGNDVTLESEFTVYEFEFIADTIRVFTTRPDTIFGATFVVLAPEHELIECLVTDNAREMVMSYVTDALRKSELERQETKEKTGVFTGGYATNPATGEKIPIWTADYVLSGYGTGAIMAVPAHDERDYEFAEKFGLPIVDVIDGEKDKDNVIVTEGVLQNSGHFDGMRSEQAREEVVAWLEQTGVGHAHTTYKIRDWSVSRQRYWGAPIPIVNCETHGAVLVPDEQLPVVLPELEDFAPSGDGRSALARATEWLNTTCPECGGPATRETDTLDTYICSSWYFLRYFDGANEDKIFDSATVDKWMPIDFYNGGDHATAHMIYARFVTRFFWHQGLVDNPEPFKKFLFNGKVTASDGTMFSKSKGNGIDPLEIINNGYGADALRTYLMFAAPLEVWARWDPQGVPGTYRFLSRVWNLVQEFVESKDNSPSQSDASESSLALLRTIHPTIRKVTRDLEDQKYNTAIAAMMEATNDLYALKKGGFTDRGTWQFALESLVALVAPFAPHMADELWHDLGRETSVQRDSWPKWDDQYLVSDTMTIIVQVNGKLRAKLDVARDTSEDEVKKLALADENVKKHVSGEPKKVIYVKNKLVSVVA